MPTSRQDHDFLETVVPTTLLDDAIDWIKKNLNPDEVFEEKEILAFVRDNFSPEVVYDSELDTWAENNGYEKSA